jgi:biofilm PGA synthesis lipoprotein PgaB
MRILLLFASGLPLAAIAGTDTVAGSPVEPYAITHPLQDRLTVLAYHDVREDIRRDFAPDQYAVSAENLAMQFSWLRDNGYKVVSVEQVLAAVQGRRPLPPKAVLLTFDDGLASVYYAAFPILKMFGYPALVSLVTAWIETEVEVQYENHLLTSRDFLSWEQVNELQASDLIEIGSHTHNMHYGIPGNPQGNLQPAAVTRLYADGYESQIDYLTRIETDLATSVALIKKHTSQAPRVVVWPYGKHNSYLRSIAGAHGLELSLSLNTAYTNLQGYPVIGRELMVSNPGIAVFAPVFIEPATPEIVRAAQVDLDYVYDPDPVVQENNLSVLLDRIKSLGISHVFLQAFADPDADGAADAMYFPNRRMPMRADLFNRVAWQLKTRSNVRVFAWMPLLAFTGATVDPDWQMLEMGDNGPSPDADGEPRLSVFNPAARQFITDIYADLATYSEFDGIHFHDDGRISDEEDANPAAMAAYRKELGDDFTIAASFADPDLQRRWANFKATTLDEFSLELRDTVATYRPEIKTSRNLFASALLDEYGTIYLAQDYDEFLASYDYVTIMAMPLLEGATSEQNFYAQLIKEVYKRPGAIRHTVFQLQTVDWRDGFEPLASDKIGDQMRSLQSQGVMNLAYYPDDFLKDHPTATELLRGMSLTSHPVVQ